MQPELIVFIGAGVVSLIAFTTLILLPAIGSFGRGWEKATAAVLSLLVLTTLVAVGIALGFVIILNWDHISGIFT
jgi:hypothetical protein